MKTLILFIYTLTLIALAYSYWTGTIGLKDYASGVFIVTGLTVVIGGWKW